MPAYNFQKRFAEAVESGEKCQTIRQTRKRPTKAGDALFLYFGQRTKWCRLLRAARCTSVQAIDIYPNEVFVDGLCELKPFFGVLIQWKPKELETTS